MEKNIAKFVRALGRPNWYAGSALYHVTPPVEMNDLGFLTEAENIICGITPAAIDHGQPETALFFAKRDGSLWYLGDYEGSAVGVYVKGKVDHQAAFSKLQQGYVIKK